MAPKVIDKSEKKHQILQAALRVFAKSGLANTKMVHIAEAAGIGKGTIYEYFKSKDELFWLAFDVFVEEMGILLEQKMLTTTDPVEQLRIYITGWEEMLTHEFEDMAGILIEIWAESLRHGQETGLAKMQEMYQLYRLQIQSIIDRGIETGQFRKVNSMAVGAMIIGAVDGFFLQWVMEKDLFPVSDALNQFADVIIKGLIKK